MKTIKKFLFIMIVSLFAVVVIPTKAATKESARDRITLASLLMKKIDEAIEFSKIEE